MKLVTSAIFLVGFIGITLGDCPTKKLTTKLICYYGQLNDVEPCKCSHVVLPANSDVKTVERFREHAKGVKVLITVNEFNQELVELLESTKIDGIEIDLKKLDSKNDINDFISTVRTKLGANLFIQISIPTSAELLAKYYDFKALSKSADLFVLQTAFLGASKNVTFHPSRLSGLWDMQNTDSVVDLVSGLGAPISKLVITSPIQAFQFKLQSENHTAPGSPALEVRTITRNELCELMGNGGNWTLERDQDRAGPYIFSEDQWIAFDDPVSIDIKAKYARIRGLAGLALKDLSQDGGEKCESSLLDAAYKGLSKQARAPRGAVLHSLEREILDSPARPLDSVQVSPYRISRVIDVEGNVHVVRQDTRTEFECSRQGYFVHPRSCGRFYRCVKFNQLTDEFSVFEFDCPAGLAFDEKVEVCVWPGSLSHASPCAGSSEIAPVPKERFICPGEQGYYADPENCRWFFACLDHGKSPLSAYEFRCPFGLVYDESRLMCEWPWLVPKCASGLAVGSEVVYGGAGLAALDQYNGLGSLGVTALGGLHGPLQAPVAKVYSNVGLAGSYSGGLSVNAAQSLEKAGLLNYGYVSNVGFSSGDAENAQYSQYGLKTGYNGINVAQGAGLGSGVGVAQQSYVSLNSGDQGSYQNNIAGGLNSGSGSLNSGYQSSYQNSAGSLGSGYQGSYQSNVGSLNSGSGILNFGSGSLNSGYQSSFQNTATVNQNLGLSVEANTAKDGGLLIGQINDLAYNSVANPAYGISGNAEQNFYTSGQSELNYGRGVAGSINIVKGGYSAVAPSQDNVQITNLGEAQFNYVTASPASVSTITSIPSVGAVPVPGIRVAGGFETYNGGVVANVPELQYKVQHNGLYANNLNTRVDLNAYGYANATNQVNVAVDVGYRYPKPSIAFSEEPVRHVTSGVTISSTPSPVVVGYDYPKPAIKFEEGLVKQNGGISYQQINTVHSGYGYSRPALKVETVQPVAVGYDYPKPSIRFEERPQVSTIRPVVQTVIQPVVQQAVVQKQNIQVSNIQGYDYPKPVVAFREEPQIIVSSTAKPVVSVQPAISVTSQGYDYPKPVVAFEEKPQVIVSTARPIEVKQPVSFQGYEYPKPVIAFEERPQVHISSTVRPAVQVQQQAISSSSFQGYDYPKPLVVFEEKPQIAVTYLPSSTARPIIKQEGYQYPKPSVVFEEKPIQIHSTVRPVVFSSPAPVVVKTNPVVSYSEGYNYPKPSVQFEERPLVTYKQPAVVQPVSTYSYKNVVQSSVSGYSYPKPEIAFVTPKPVIAQPSVSYLPSSTARPVVIQQSYQPAVVSSYSYSAPSTVKPAVVEQRVLQPAVSYLPAQRPVVNYLPAVKPTVQPVVVQQPSVSYLPVQKPAVVSSYSFSSAPIVEQRPIQPSVSYLPAVKPTVQQPSVNYLPVQKPAVVSSYSYSAPSPRPVIVEQRPVQPAVSYLPAVKPTVQPVVVQQPSVNYLPVQKPAVVSSYSYTAPIVEQRPSVSYLPAVKPTIQPVIVEKPAVSYLPVQKPAVVSSFSYTAPSTVRPVVVEQKQIQPVVNYLPVQPTVRPAVVSSYSYVAPSTPRPTVIYEQKPVQPVVSYLPVERPKPAVISSYSYVAPTTPKPAAPAVFTSYYITPKPEVFVQQQPVQPTVSYIRQKPAIISRVSYTAPSPRPVVLEPSVSYLPSTTARPLVNTGYQYPKPSVAFVEEPQPVKEIPFVAKKAYITGSQNQQFHQEQKQVYVENYQAIQTTPRYEYQQYSKVDSGYVYDKPAVQFEEGPIVVENYEAKTVRPTLATVINNVVAKTQPFTFYDSRITPTIKPVVQSYSTVQPVVVEQITSKPIARYSFSSFDNRAPDVVEPNVQYLPVEQPKIEYLPVEPPRVEYLPVKKVTPRPTVVYQEPVREYLPVTTEAYVEPTIRYVPTKRPKVTTEVYVQPSVEYLPVRKPTIQYLPATTPAYEVPTREYLPARKRVKVTTQAYVIPESSTVVYEEPTREYLPVRKRVKVTTESPVTPSSEYLPVRTKPRVRITTSVPTEAFIVPEVTTLARDYLPARKRVKVTTTVATPTREYLLSIPDRNYLPVDKPRTIIKVNDFHPVLSAKLGAQCTCASKVVRLRKRPIKILVEEEDDDDDGYEVEQDNEARIVENYEYEPQKTVDITPVPTLLAPSTEVYRKRVRPTTVVYDAPVTEAVELFLRKRVSPVVKKVDESPSDREIVKAVRTGLKLVKQAAKEGAKEGTQEVLNGNARLRGEIDCQRAGLFRHPTQCNKFYTCRWDCHKNKFTLHMFNCPVHLTFDSNLGACNWPSQGPACHENTLLPSD